MKKIKILAIAFIAIIGLAGCEGPEGPPGTNILGYTTEFTVNFNNSNEFLLLYKFYI